MSRRGAPAWRQAEGAEKPEVANVGGRKENTTLEQFTIDLTKLAPRPWPRFRFLGTTGFGFH